MFLKRFYHEGLAQASYMVGCQARGEALVIDPNRDIARYMEAAEQEGMRIVAVTETHIHADFVSGARELAARTGARLYLSGEGPAEWKYSYAREAGAVLLREGDTISVGRVRLQAMHTPGHTPEHISFLLTDTAAAGAGPQGEHEARPMGIFTGDFVFVGDVGRPDLLEKAAGVMGTKEEGARQLHRSLLKFRELPGYLQIWPGHGAGSSCGRALGAVPQSTVGYEKMFNWALNVDDEEAFVQQVLEGQPDPPPYFAEMKRVNRGGPAPRPTQAPEQGAIGELQRRLELGLPVIDLRPEAEFAHAHLHGAQNVPWGKSFLQWAGWLVPYDRQVGLISGGHDLEQVAREMQMIGLDRPLVHWPIETILAASREGAQQAGTFERLSSAELQPRIAERGEDVFLVDVRTPAEHAVGHIPGSVNIPLGDLRSRAAEIPRDRSVIVYCAAGSRSPIAASMLKRLQWPEILEMHDGFDGWASRGFPVARPRQAVSGSPDFSAA